jgi:hypothetical protein
MSLFKKPDAPLGLTFMLRGQPGTGKTRFALGACRVTKLPCAYLGTDRGAALYRDDPEVGGFLAVETRESEVIDAALAELREDWGKSFGAAVVDTVTDVWNAEQKEFEVTGADGNTGIPMRAWRPLRDKHEQKLRDLQALPLHTFLICEEKPIYEKKIVGKEVTLVEVGSREDADKKDSYVCDIRLRMFTEGDGFFAEVLKDRTGTYPLGSIVENPRVEMWIKGAVVAGAKPARAEPVSNGTVASGVAKSGNGIEESPDDAAKRLVKRIGELDNKFALQNWWKKHGKEVAALPEDLRDVVIAAKDARKNELLNGAGAQEAGAR